MSQRPETLVSYHKETADEPEEFLQLQDIDPTLLRGALAGVLFLIALGVAMVLARRLRNP